jgi:hypothetical protein
MDTLTQLALMTKAKLVFETPDTFLSFPASVPLSYAPDQLDFSNLAGQENSVFPDFCQLANAMPQGVVYPPTLSSFLWEQYGYVLQNAVLAQSSLTAQDEADLQQAEAFLYAQAPDGTRTASPALVAYNQYQQAWLQAMQTYTSAKFTALASTDPSVQAQWQNVDEPRLSAQVQAAEDDWNALGFRAQVDQARAVEQACAAKSPALQWDAWRGGFNPDVDVATWPGTGVSYALTAYSPFDVLAQSGWPTFTLTSSEIEQLVGEAPPELKNIFDSSGDPMPTDSLSFEFCSVTLNRPWFHPEMFSARFWRLPDPSVQLSDGGTPPQGQCPAYISGLVFARNIVVTPATGPGPEPPRPLPAFPVFTLRQGIFGELPPRPLPPPGVIRPVAPPGVIRPLPPPEVLREPIMVRPEITEVRTAEPAAAVSPAVAAPPPGPVLAGTIQRTGTAPQPLPAEPATLPPSVVARLNLGTFRSPVLVARPPYGDEPGGGPPGDGTAGDGTAGDGPVTGESGGSGATTAPGTSSGGGQPNPVGTVSILAFICKPLPKCPDPDPALNWE